MIKMTIKYIYIYIYIYIYKTLPLLKFLIKLPLVSEKPIKLGIADVLT